MDPREENKLRIRHKWKTANGAQIALFIKDHFDTYHHKTTPEVVKPRQPSSDIAKLIETFDGTVPTSFADGGGY